MDNKFFNKEENNLEAWWDSIRKRNADHSFPAMTDWIRKMHKKVGRSRLEKIKRRKRVRWFALAILPIFLILSCTIPVKRVEKSGSLVNFSIDKKEDQSLQKLSPLQQVSSFTFYQFLHPDQPDMVYFIFFIPDTEQEKLQLISRELKALNGLGNLDISSIYFTIRESLFSTFWHKTLKLGKQQKPAAAEVKRNIQATLNDKGLGFISINMSNGKDEKVEFISSRPNPDSLTTTNKSGQETKDKGLKTGQIQNPAPGTHKLQIFDWLLGSWKIKYSPSRGYHHWLRINDSLFMCFIIKYRDEALYPYGDDGPDISVGFSIKYSRSDSVILSLRGIEWKFLSANDNEVNFKNETTPKSAHVKWTLRNEKKNWQSVISGESNLEIVTLVRDDNADLDKLVKEFIAKHPDVVKKIND